MTAGCRTVIDRSYLEDPAHQRRWIRTAQFVQQSTMLSHGNPRRGLDLGDRTPLTDQLERIVGCPFDTTAVDLDIDSLTGNYGIVTAFEVLEHLFNPLHLLLQVRAVLSGADARLFVSMPLNKPRCLASPDHFHEMRRNEAMLLFDRAGFSVLRSGLFRFRHPLFYCSGFKPLLRAWYEKIQIYELVCR